MLLIHRSLNYTQFKCLNGIGDSSWSFYDSATGTCITYQNFAFVRFMPRTILFGSMIFYKFAGKDLGLLNIKSFKSKQYNLQAKGFGFHGCLIADILNIFCILPYARMIMALPEQLIGSTGPYTILTIALCNELLEKNNLSRRTYMCRCTSR